MLKPVLAAAGGVVVGFLVAKAKYEKAAYAYANERIEQAKVYAEERAERTIAKFQAEASDEALEAVTAAFEQNDPEQMVKLVEDENPVVAGLIQNYQGFSAPAASTIEDEESESHIVLIRRKEFFEKEADDGYDQTSVTYYQNDDILYDDVGLKQLDVKAAIGSVRPTWFGNEADDENVCYVRNTKLKIEFEVIRSQGSFAKDVLGLGGEE